MQNCARSGEGNTRTNQLFVLKMDGHFGGGTANVDERLAEAGRTERYVGIVRESETFFRNPDEISIEMMITVLVVNGGDSIVARRDFRPLRNGSSRCLIDGCGTVTKRPIEVFRPAGA